MQTVKKQPVQGVTRVGRKNSREKESKIDKRERGQDDGLSGKERKGAVGRKKRKEKETARGNE